MKVPKRNTPSESDQANDPTRETPNRIRTQNRIGGWELVQPGNRSASLVRAGQRAVLLPSGLRL